MGLPSKLQSGQNFKTSTVRAVNQIIDYLKTQRLVSDNSTIRLNQLTSGISISAVQNTVSKGGGSTSIKHPFKLSIATDEQGNQTLNIAQARITINGDQGTSVYFGYEENDIGLPQSLQLPTQQGQFNVIGYICFDNNTPSNGLNTQGWGAGCVYSTSTQFTMSSGFFHFIIGTIKVETGINGGFVYSVTRQLLFSSLDVNDDGILRQFRGHWQLSSYPTDGSVVESMVADKFLINEGKIYVDGKIYQAFQFTDSQTPSEDVLFCLIFNPIESTCEIQKVSVSDFVYLDTQTNIYQIPICMTYSSAVSAVGLLQFITGSIHFNILGKVLLNEQDQLPSQYLNTKIAYSRLDYETLSDEDKQKYSGNSYIVGLSKDLNKETESETTAVNLQDTLYWDWQSIEGFDKDKTLKIISEKGSLKFEKDDQLSQHITEGSIAELLEFKTETKNEINESGEEQEKTTIALRYKPQYDETLLDEAVSFLIQNKQKKADKLTFSDQSAGQGVLVWNYTNKQPKSLIPIESEQGKEDQKFCLVGVKGQELSWDKYDANGVNLQGSIQNVFEIAESTEDETQGQRVLRVKSEYDGTVTQFNFLNLDKQGKLQITTFAGQGKNSLFLWNNEENYPITIDCLDKDEQGKKTYFLTGNKTDGVSWVDINNYVGKVRCTEIDEQGYLSQKVVSFADESILVQLNEDQAFQTLQLRVNPQYFTSSDETVVITYTEEGKLDFTGAGRVKVSETDTADFLGNKIYSENQTIIVENGSNGQNEAVNIQINPDIFVSADGSVLITPMENGTIDFSAKSKSQLESQKNSIIITPPPQDGSSTTTKIDVNPAYFTSSDESIVIEETETSLDFKSNGKVKCTETDTADFLNTKIDVDPSIAALITLDKQANQLLIKSAMTDSGILVVENGVVKPFSAPASGKYLFACENGTFSWKEYKDCENACE